MNSNPDYSNTLPGAPGDPAVQPIPALGPRYRPLRTPRRPRAAAAAASANVSLSRPWALVQRAPHGGWRVFVPGFRSSWMLGLMGGCMLFAFAMATIAINSDEGRRTLLRSSAFLVAITTAIEAFYTAAVCIAVARGPWARKRRYEWHLSWMLVISLPAVTSGAYVLQRVAWCRKHRLCDRPVGDRPHECISGLRTTTAMGGLRLAAPGLWALAVLWYVLWRLAQRSERRLREADQHQPQGEE